MPIISLSMTRYRRTIVSRFLLHLLVCLTTIANAQNGVINGFVRNQATNESLAYVNIFIKDGLIGAITDRDGYYVLSGVPRDDLTLVASLIGYGMAEVQLNLTETRSVRHDFVLAPQSLKGQEITVTAERQRFREKVEVSAVTLDPRQIQVAPAFVEADIFRTIQYLPGVQSISDYSSALYVRGSTPDQNLILLDGITIYNPFHFGGVFSTFNTDAIKQADFIAGGFPANYGGRMGAVLEITNRDGNANEFAGKANISLISSKLLLEGPLPKMGPVKGTYMLSGRRTYFDALFNGIAYLAGATKDPNFVEFPYYFYDLNGKASLDMGTMHRVVLSHFVGDDVIHVDVDNSSIWEDDYSGVNAPIRSTYTSESYLDWRWGNRATSASWRWIITPKLVSRLYAAQSTFRYTVHLEESNTSRWVYADNPTDFNKSEFGFQLYDRVRDRTIRLGLTYLPNDRHTVLTGIERKYYDFGTGWDFWSHFEDPDTSLAMRDTILSISYEPFEEAAYIQDQWRLGSRFVLQPGVRFSRYSLHKGWNVEPRMSGKFFIQSNVALTGAWGEYYQYLTTANPSDEQLRLIDLWLPVPPDQPAPHSVHHIAGIEYLSDNNLLVKVEIYNKSLDNLLYLKHGAMLFLIPED
ncbi:MAG: TonB-dependent receptor, partial [Candidatus Marinimicrobia bacterium]|nr:TonB-dependent receptor [Candidatus Neomarinimicrobiota bacterium]